MRARLEAAPRNSGEGDCALKVPLTRVPVEQRPKKALWIFDFCTHFVDEQLASPSASRWFASEQLEQHNAESECIRFIRDLRVRAIDCKMGGVSTNNT